MGPLPTTTITELHASILDALRARFGDRIRQYGAYEPERVDGEDAPTRIETPAMLLALDTTTTDLISKRPDGSIGTVCRWVMLIVESQRVPDLHIALAELAIEAESVIFSGDVGVSPAWVGTHWGLGHAVNDPGAVTSTPNALQGVLHGRAARSVAWDQVAYLERSA